MKKYLVLALCGIAAGAAYAISGLSFSNSTGIITVDSVSGAACIIGTAPTCMLPYAPAGVLSASTTRSSGNIATSNIFQTVLAQSNTRMGCMVSNNSTSPMQIDVGSTPAAVTAVTLAAGARFSCATQAGLVINDQVSLASATSGSAYSVWSQ